MLADGLAAARGIRVLGADHRIFNNYLEGITGSNGILLRSGSADGTENNGTEFYRVYRTHVVNNTLVNGRGISVGSTGLAAPRLARRSPHRRGDRPRLRPGLHRQDPQRMDRPRPFSGC
jgi:hypothetical protein